LAPSARHLVSTVGFAMLAWIGGKALMKYHAQRKTVLFAKTVAWILAAPFLGLMYVLFFPVVGLGMLAWMAGRALLKRAGAE
jgi:hypothetical protein